MNRFTIVVFRQARCGSLSYRTSNQMFTDLRMQSPMAHRLLDFAVLTETQRDHAAGILSTALSHAPSAYNRPGEARTEVERRLSDDAWFGLAAVDGDQVLGWIGCIETYSFAFEVHPLVVEPACQRRGLGSNLLAAIERAAANRGALSVYLGCDDDFGGTMLFGLDLFPGVLEKVATLAPTTGHPFTFYRRYGYEVVGLIPDTNGRGRPDILMAKSVAPATGP